MPKFTIDEIKEKIVTGEIQAISVDTNIFDRYGCNLRYALLRRLDQFQATNVDVLLSEVVIGEVRSHLVREAADTQRTLKRAMREHRLRWHLQPDDEVDGRVSLDTAATDFAEAEIRSFIQDVGVEIVEVNDEMGIGPELVRRYFAPLPPFEDKETKKFEFPDALALLSLEFHVKDNDGILICVSNDTGWKLFAEQSDHVVVLDDLADALSLFNQAGEPIANEIVQLWRADSVLDFASNIDNEIADWCVDLEYEATGDGPANWEIDSQDVEFSSIEEIGEPRVVSFGGKQITFAVSLRIKLQFYADFSFYVHDATDRDDVTIGSAMADRTLVIPVEATITASYEGDIAELELNEVALAGRIPEVDFGYVDPFAGENPNHEKY